MNLSTDLLWEVFDFVAKPNESQTGRKFMKSTANDWNRGMKQERGQFAGFTIICILLASSAALIVLVATSSYGLALSPDSASYVSAARSLTAGNGLTSHKLVPLTWYPPLYPFILSLIETLFGLDPVNGARLLSAASFGLIVLLSGQLFRTYLATPSLIYFGITATLFSPILFRVSTYAWTEPLLIVWTLLFMLVLRDYLGRRSVGLLLLLAFVAGMASLTRYIGIACAVAGVIAILFNNRSPYRSRLFHLFLFGIVSATPLGAWAVRNYLVAQELMGDYGPSRYNLFHNMYFASIEVFSWFFPIDLLADRLPYTRVHFVLGTILGCLVGAVFRPWRVSKRIKETLCHIAPVLLFSGAYITLLVTASTLWALEKISSRFMSPVYVPVVLFVLCYIDLSLPSSAHPLSLRILGFSLRVKVANLVAVILVAFLTFSFSQVAGAAGQLMQYGGDYMDVSWRTSETVSFLEDQLFSRDDVESIFSNDPEAVYFHTGYSVPSSPEAQRYCSGEARRPVSTIVEEWPGRHSVLLVWFEETDRSYLFDVDELRQIAEFSVVASFEDGMVYKVSTR